MLKSGLELERVHKVFRYRQSNYMKSFIERNIAFRAEDNSKQRKSCLKLVNNSLFGKSLYSELKRREKASVINNAIKYLKAVRDPLFKRLIVLRENRVINISGAHEIRLSHPLQIGFTVLEHSITIMRDFFTGVLKKHYGSRVKLAYTDTDSFIFSLATDNLTEELRQSLPREYLDTYNFHPSHPL